MLNPRLDILGPGPFQRLAALLEGLAPAPGLEPLNMALGEPQRPYPDFVGEIIHAKRQLYGRYPPQKASPELRRANVTWLEKRYGLAIPDEAVGKKAFASVAALAVFVEENRKS